MTIQLNDPTLLRRQAYIDGAWCNADAGATHEIRNPANGKVIALVPDMGAAETRRAIAAADAALPAWRAKTAKERAAILRRWFDLILASQEDLARLMTLEQGKPLAEARGEVAYGASFIEWFAEEGKRVYGDVIPSPAGDKRLVVIKQPVGVTAAITPWNFPIAMITRKVGPALAAGCTSVVKPAEATPLCALALAELGERAGIPQGVLNVVTTARPAEVGTELTGNPTVRKLSFTGSTPVGKRLMAQCAETVKKVSLELGGNAPFIVFDDADVDAAVRGAMASKYRNAGQTCVCANRLIVQDGIYDLFAEKLAQAVRELKVGDGMEDGVQIGPLINDAAAGKVERLVEDALSKGAHAIAGGKPHALGGNFFTPTVLTDVTPAMMIAQEEIFGPVAPLFRFKTDEEAVALANNTRYGLAAYFYSRDIGRVWRVAEQLEYGMVGINEGMISNEVAPFGGMKESGVGREGSRYGIDEYLQIKYLCLGGMQA
ncbi:MAG TPA: NAD-dependent succinate-semialdehyde dehydrogenase [Noviherbaspirillum sp.]|uniref:NAD-dependent succinate-semialdehyde dehydrogenase n=1 Tax=Noviherbaspirillum sp. TaxID=1926288 RepID=UPI002D5BD40A|nr:NAD-dependent succinate-semialdehyde dehydrogenase [Noviherbaspirillum sp.]HYD94506.1 NAD-dependent succinate-semialdehyde dehydrogenase [Noviherbaspirillum sp.]